jgi:hypothetical protein
VTFFSTYFESVSIDYGNTYKAAEAVCPFVFKNLASIQLNYQVDSFLFVSLFRIQKVNITSIFSINSNINELEVNGYNYMLDTGLLHPLVFNNMQNLALSGTINAIQTDLFENIILNYVLQIDFNLDCLGDFFHKIGIGWMNFLSFGSKISFASLAVPYIFPDKDFCIFAQLPRNKSISLSADCTSNQTSLTFAWVFQDCNLSINSTMLNSMLEMCKVMRNQTDQTKGHTVFASYTDFYQTRLVYICF